MARWMFDRCVTWFGTIIENALSERVEVQAGTKKESRPKYTLARLLEEGIYLPRSLESVASSGSSAYNPWAALMAWAGKPGSGVKRWVYQKPVD